jgi:hypothetical protein
MNGPVVQAGSISGGVHHQTTNIGSQNVTVNVRAPKSAERQRRQGVLFHVRLAATVLPPMLVAAVVVGVVEGLAAGAHIGVRLLLVASVPALAMAVIALRAARSGRRFTTLLGSALDRTISRFMASLPIGTLVFYVVGWSALWVIMLVEEPSAGPTSPNPAPFMFMLIFIAVLAAQTGRLIVRRR